MKTIKITIAALATFFFATLTAQSETRSFTVQVNENTIIEVLSIIETPVEEELIQLNQPITSFYLITNDELKEIIMEEKEISEKPLAIFGCAVCL